MSRAETAFAGAQKQILKDISLHSPVAAVIQSHLLKRTKGIVTSCWNGNEELQQQEAIFREELNF
jgi:hypothetical protein